MQLIKLSPYITESAVLRPISSLDVPAANNYYIIPLLVQFPTRSQVSLEPDQHGHFLLEYIWVEHATV